MRVTAAVWVLLLLPVAFAADRPLVRMTRVQHACCGSPSESSLFLEVAHDGTVTADTRHHGRIHRMTGKLGPASLAALKAEMEDPALALLNDQYPCLDGAAADERTIAFAAHDRSHTSHPKTVRTCNFFPLEEQHRAAYPPALLRLACNLEAIHYKLITGGEYVARGCDEENKSHPE